MEINPLFPSRGASLARVFSFRSAPQRTNGATEGAPSQSPRLPLITRASRNPPPGNGKAGRASAHFLSPPRCGHRRVSPSETRGRSGTHKRQSCGEGRAPRPARPSPARPGREGQATACARRLPAGRGAPRAQAAALQDPDWPQPRPGPPSVCPLSVHPRAGVLRTYGQAARGDQQRRQQQREDANDPRHVHPHSSWAAPQSAPGPAAPLPLTEDPRPGTAPRRSCSSPGACSAPRSAPRRQSRARRRAGGAWGPRAAA